MSDELVFYTNPMSRGRIARWMLEEIGAPYRTELLDFRSGPKPASFLAINPMGKVPAIVHGEVIVTECAAICTYLADAFPRAGLAPPPGDPARGAYYRWMFFAAGPIEAASANKALGVTVSPDKKRMMGYGSMEDLLDGIEYAVSRGDYLAGGRFSAADLYFGSLLGWGMMFGTLERRPAFEAYMSRLNDRPAAIRARKIDDALLPPEMRAKSPT